MKPQGLSPEKTAVDQRRPGPLRRLKALWPVLRVALLSYVGLALYLFIGQARYVYFPEKTVAFTPADVGLDYEDVTLRHPNGERVRGWFVPAEKQPARGTVLFCHGNAGNIGHRLDSILIFHQLNFEVFIFDYRGYGNSDGKPSESKTYADALAAWEYLVETRQCRPERIVIFGRSLGGAVAAHTAGKTRPGLLILESCFTSTADMGRELYPYLPVRLLTRFNYPTRQYLRDIPCPVVVIHSPDDEIIPFSHGKALYEAANPPKEFITLRGGHNDGFMLSRDHYIRSLEEALEQRLGGRGL